MNHDLQDRVSLELSFRVAARLRASAGPWAAARENLDRWSERNKDTPSLLRCYAEWREILERLIQRLDRVQAPGITHAR
jgi:hypothetical protein